MPRQQARTEGSPIAPRPVTAATRLIAVVGLPIRHSLSPILHNAAFTALGLDWVYVALPMCSDRSIETLQHAWSLGIEGLSVTMPHKQAAAAAAVYRDPVVERVGAANTLVRRDDGWAAHNTDVPGFRTFVTEDLGLDPTQLTFGIVGAGGVAAAVVDALGDAASLAVWNRHPEKATALVGVERTITSPAQLDTLDVLVSCVPGEAVLDALVLRRGQVVIDLAYGTKATPLLERASAAGAQCHDGLGLLIRQAALQFELWTGEVAPLGAMRHAVATVAP